MPASVATKLKIKEGFRLLLINEPPDFCEKIDISCIVGRNLKEFDQIHWFVKNSKEFENGLPTIIPRLLPAVICWVYFPKGSSKVQTDLSRDKGWDALHQYEPVQWLSLISYDETWSAFGLRKQEAQKKPIKKASTLVTPYIDKVQKTIQIPQDLSAQFKKHRQEEKYFMGLAYSHKKEYIEWIVNAKKEDTRQRRLEQMIEKLSHRLKNPSDK